MTDTNAYRLVCGLEIHVELKTASKMFCGCKNDPFFAPQPNIYTCPYCLGRQTKPPVPNRKAIEFTAKFGLYVGGQITSPSYFERKHYVYPDMPKGYQISQCTQHFVKGGQVNTPQGVVRLIEAHLEEDAAKLIHQEVKGSKMTLIDFNRSGVPLIEIVSAADIHSSKQAVAYAKNIQSITRYLGISDADMEKGQMRFDANISLQTKQQAADNLLPDYKVEVKNINSFKALEQTIDFEIERQSELLSSGQKVPQETRGFDMNSGKTIFQRTKGNSEDFRATICPEMSTIVLSKQILSSWFKQKLIIKEEYLKKWQAQFQLENKYAASFLTNPTIITWAEKLWQLAKKENLPVNKLANYLVNKKLKFTIHDDQPQLISAFQDLISSDQVDEGELTSLIKQTLQSYPHEFKRYLQGEKQLLGFFMGQIMRTSDRKLDATLVNKLLKQELQSA